MKRSLPLLSVILFAGFSLSFTRVGGAQENAKPPEQDKVPASEAARVNPVKTSPEGLAEARKFYGYDCAMCHGNKGDGKGELVESMKLTMHDWHDPATLEGKTDGELFYIITKGKGKMIPEGDRVSEKIRWELVNLVRAMAAKGSEQKAATANPSK